MSKTSKPTGRPVTDEKGNRSWAWTGQDNMDTARVRALGEDLSLETPAQEQGPPALDPYNRNAAAGTGAVAVAEKEVEKAAKRRTLDDMRRLSEHIKKTRVWNRGD